MKKIGILVGSLHQQSINRKIADSFIKIGHPDLQFSSIDISKLPLFSEDSETPVLPAVQAFRNQIAAVDLILIMTPEYNRSIPGVLKNALDWASRPYGTSVLHGKQVAVAGVSPGQVGTAAAQSHLRAILPILGLNQIQQPEMYLVWKPDLLNAEGIPNNPQTLAFFQKFLNALAK